MPSERGCKACTCATCVFFQERPGLFRSKTVCASPSRVTRRGTALEVTAERAACDDYRRQPSQAIEDVLVFAASRGERSAAPRPASAGAAATVAYLADLPENPTEADIAALEARAAAEEARAAALAARAAAAEARARLARSGSAREGDRPAE